VQAINQFKAKGVDEVWCVSVNDAPTMSAWGRECKAQGKVRMMADGSAQLTQAMGVDQDLTARGMGIRGQRYAMVIENGVVRQFHLEKPGQFEVSSAEYVLGRL
jgi:glutaredoxin/glutathione-dependent peroxiredoxin